MKKNDTSIRRARQAQAERITSDPVVASNMLRWVRAFEMLLCGRPGPEALHAEPIIIGGLTASEGERRFLMGITSKMNRDQVSLSFDRGNAVGTPTGVDVFRSEGEMVRSYPSCGVWAPADGGRLLIVARYRNAPSCHFAFEAGGALVRRDGLPYDATGPCPGADAVDAGFGRAGDRLHRLVTSEAYRTIPHTANRTMLQGVGGGEFAATLMPLAA